MKRALQATDNSSSQRPRIDTPAAAAPPSGAAATHPPILSAGDQKRKSSLLHRQYFSSIIANSDLAALEKLSPEIVMELINATDRASGLTPLMLAIKSRSAETASWLISQGAKPDRPCARGTSPLIGRGAAAGGTRRQFPLMRKGRLHSASPWRKLWPRESGGGVAAEDAVAAGAWLPGCRHSDHPASAGDGNRCRPCRRRRGFPVQQAGFVLAESPVACIPVIFDLRKNVHVVIAPQHAIREQVDQFTGLTDCVKRLVSLLDLSDAVSGDEDTLAQHWLSSTHSYAVIAGKLQEATKGSAALRSTLAGTGREVSPAQKRLICAGILASLGEPSVFDAPYSGQGLSADVEACFNKLALHHARLLSQVGQQAEQDLVNVLDNLHGTCMGAFTGKQFHPIDLYISLTKQCGLYDIPAKRISDAFAEIWVQHEQSGTATRKKALAQALDKRSRSGEVFEQMRHDSALSGNEVMFHWLLNRQLDLINAWHKKVLGPAAQ